MKNILIIGDSHVAALKQAEDIAPKSVKLDFLSAMGPSRKCIEFLNDGISIADEPEWGIPKNAYHTRTQYSQQYHRLIEQFTCIAKGEVIKYSNYEAIVIVGGDFFLKPWHHYAIDVSCYSYEFLKDLFSDYRQGYHSHWLKLLRKSNNKADLYSLTPPLINELAFEVDESIVSQTFDKEANEFFSSTENFIRLGLSSLGSNYISIPDELLSSRKNATSYKYKTGNPNDMGHLNRDGGVVRLKNLLDTILNDI